jgi:hypothetical protein
VFQHVIIIGCGERKLSEPAPAAQFYTGSLFDISKKYALRQIAKNEADGWFILSAEHGILKPEQVITYYNKTPDDIDHQEWCAKVIQQIREIKAKRITLLAGMKYTDPLKTRGLVFENPLNGLLMGDRRTFLAGNKIKRRKDLDKTVVDVDVAPPGHQIVLWHHRPENKFFTKEHSVKVYRLVVPEYSTLQEILDRGYAAGIPYGSNRGGCFRIVTSTGIWSSVCRMTVNNSHFENLCKP